MSDNPLRTSITTRLRQFTRVPAPLDGLKHAAVALALTEGDAGPALLLTQRAALRAHSRQYALPGGRCDPGETAEQAALRELAEELGLALPAENVLGLLDDYPTRSGYVMTPVVVWAGASPAITPNPDEVHALHHITLAELAREDIIEWLEGVDAARPVIRLHLSGMQVHAPTAAILHQFAEVILRGRNSRVTHIDQPQFAWR
jgi:8-oxo-dGTP pyrophosphatase MutT (NUDIX family)